ncbi:hypothetical protein V6Z12_D10G101400 [Gossypium hirsutum]
MEGFTWSRLHEDGDGIVRKPASGTNRELKMHFRAQIDAYVQHQDIDVVKSMIEAKTSLGMKLPAMS